MRHGWLPYSCGAGGVLGCVTAYTCQGRNVAVGIEALQYLGVSRETHANCRCRREVQRVGLIKVLCRRHLAEEGREESNQLDDNQF